MRRRGQLLVAVAALLAAVPGAPAQLLPEPTTTTSRPTTTTTSRPTTTTSRRPTTTASPRPTTTGSPRPGDPTTTQAPTTSSPPAPPSTAPREPQAATTTTTAPVPTERRGAGSLAAFLLGAMALFGLAGGAVVVALNAFGDGF